METEHDSALRDRDFYRALLGFGNQHGVEDLLEHAANVLVERVGARETVVEVMGDDVDSAPRAAARGCAGERVAEISRFVSRGIISEAIATGQTVVTANAAEDQRFRDFESVQRHRLEAVLCVPIGRDTPVGVVYLQGAPGEGDFRAFDRSARSDAELVALALAAPAERLLVRGGLSSRPPAVVPSDPADPFSGILGGSRAMRAVVERLRLAAPLDVHILLTGPSGAGKTLLAHAVHQASGRRTGSFVEINCATLQEALVENELFGADAGAHSTVPKGGIRGKIEMADGGTLFLDEVAELSLAAQAKLLQFLQSRTYYRLGSAVLQRADVRLLAATNVDLKVAVAEKRFREDLYYRLLVLEARVPSLAERTDDLKTLSVGFLRKAVDRHGLSHKVLSPSAIHAIQTSPWPGNVRELAHRIESAAIHAHLRASEWIEARDVFPDGEGADESRISLQEATRRFQRKYVLAALESTDWNVLEAAQLLDVSRSQAYALISAFELRKV